METKFGTETNSLTVFKYLNTDKGPLYRAILRVFTDAKAAFALHLRPADLRTALSNEPSWHALYPHDIDSALTQLCEWGNLEAHHDMADAFTVEEFYRPRFLFQLTAAGEAAERAISTFYETLVQPGELQTLALEDIYKYLSELALLSQEESFDAAVAHRAMMLLSTRFEQLTSRAQTFMRSLQRRISLHGFELQTFLVYKQTLIDYLERFIGELILATYQISERILQIEKHDVSRLIDILAQRDTADTLETDRAEGLIIASKLWQARWIGLRGWFIGTQGRPSQAETLRASARSAIPDLLSAVAGINDKRVTRTDRAVDLIVLARWFAECDSDADAHRLWRAAFSLAPARHLRVDEETLDKRDEDPVPPHTSWMDAAPIKLSPRVRQQGSAVPKGPPKRVIDRSKGKELLAQLDQDEIAQITAARQLLATGRKMRLSDLPEMDLVAFDLFLDLLGEALVKKMAASDIVHATSNDGSLSIELAPTGDGSEAVIITSFGKFSGEDHYITIRNEFDESDVGNSSDVAEIALK